MRRDLLNLTMVLVAACALASAASAESLGGRQSNPACAFHVKAFIWTGTADRMHIARGLAANKSPCVEYWLSIPPLAANKKGLLVR